MSVFFIVVSDYLVRSVKKYIFTNISFLYKMHVGLKIVNSLIREVISFLVVILFGMIIFKLKMITNREKQILQALFNPVKNQSPFLQTLKFSKYDLLRLKHLLFLLWSLKIQYAMYLYYSFSHGQ